jgi:hydroxyethylthiazole kinase
MSIDLATIAALHDELRTRRPLVQNITNYVAMSVSANILLAAGASPAMVHAEEEIDDFARIAAGLVINIGTLSPSWVASMKRAAAAYSAQGKPWVLDPVAVGATRLRDATAAELMRLKPTIVRGNASEILALAGAAGATSKGVDSTAGSDVAVEAARGLATAAKTVVAVTGEVDYVTDGDTVIAIEGGHALMPLATALGCSLSGLVAAFATLTAPVPAAVAALAVYAAAGKQAATGLKGPGFLPQALADALYTLDLAGLEANCVVREVR